MMKFQAASGLRKRFVAIFKESLSRFGIGLISTSRLSQLEAYYSIRPSRILDFLLAMPLERSGKLLELLPDSKSQLRQDLYVLAKTKFKVNGYFVEFGATDGINLSNTFLLERTFAWTGILAEPAKVWHGDLKINRPNASIDYGCVWKSSNEKMLFNEAPEAELSTLKSFTNTDHHSGARARGEIYEVESISLLDLLEKYNAPRFIDYLSIDTEGSEFEILDSFDFSKYSFGIITCEHNYGDNREKIRELLLSKGYRREFENLSEWDDWYVFED